MDRLPDRGIARNPVSEGISGNRAGRASGRVFDDRIVLCGSWGDLCVIVHPLTPVWKIRIIKRKEHQEGSYSMIAENDEKQRSKLWRIAMIVSSILIIVIAIFFGIRLFTSNPLEGTWINEDSGLVMKVQGNDSALLEWPGDSEEEGTKLKYYVELKSKTFTLYREEEDGMEETDYDTSSDSGFVTETMEGTYDYSLEQGELTLTEREYGDQMIFVKK